MATGQIAAALGVLPGTVTSMLKTLDESNLATYTPYEGVRLTPAGRALALRVLRRHRLIEQFLSRDAQPHLGRSPRRSREHGARGERLARRPHRRLPRPSDDRSARRPDSARPTARWPPPADRPLADCAAGERFRVARVTDQSPEFLRFLSQAGLEIGTQGSLVANEPSRDSVTIRLGGAKQNALARSGRQTDGAVVRCAASREPDCRILDARRLAARTTVHAARRADCRRGGFR